MELVTGRAGSPHITSQQDRQKHQGIWGDGAYILATGNMLEPEVQSSNKILIKDGALMFQGALFTVKVGTTDEITINNGNQGMQRKDLVVARYKYDSSQNIESAEWVVIQGTPAASNPVAPGGTSGDIQAGDSTVDCPFMVVNLDGINVTGVDIIPEKIPTLPDLIGKLKLTHTFSVSDEIDTGETWVDGKRIYRKVIKTTDTISPNETLSLYWDMINCSEIWIDLQNSYIRSSNADRVYPLCVQYEGYFVGAWVNGAGVRLYSNSGWNEAWTKVITVRYTKV